MKTEAPILQTRSLTAAYGDRVLFCELNLCLGREKVALVGRNGVGKSTLLALLAGEESPKRGEVMRRGLVRLVPQGIPGDSASPGQRRSHALELAFSGGADLLLLDEPTQDLDDPAVDWLLEQLGSWSGGVLVASHDTRLLQRFSSFFVMAESGCRLFSGSFQGLQEELEREFQAVQERYLSRLSQMSREEEHSLHSARRRRRKEQYGRVRELDRATSSLTLNMKRSQAQVNHGRINKLRAERLEEVRDWTKAARRALRVDLPLELQMPVLPPDSLEPLLVAEGISATSKGRLLFADLRLNLSRERIAVTGGNGAGKTTLLQVLTGRREPDSGTMWVDPARLGVIEQGGANWRLEESLDDYLTRWISAEDVGRRLVAQKFPLALAQRPLRTLSPGERVRAALLGLLAHDPPVELLVLDEPTYSLDLLGQRALLELLRAWPGGLLLASHNSEFLAELGMKREIRLGSCY